MAWFLSKATQRYERMVQPRKERLFAGIEGRVVEIGAGTGPNLRYLGSAASYLAVEPNPYMHPHLRAEMRRRGVEGEIDGHKGTEGLAGLPADSADFIVSTLVLCSVEDPPAMIQAIHRVLRPGGRLLVLEHVGAAPGCGLCCCQRLVSPAFSLLADGCQPTRDTGGLLRTAPFGHVEIEEFHLPLGPIAPHICGYAEKAR